MYITTKKDGPRIRSTCKAAKLIPLLPYEDSCFSRCFDFQVAIASIVTRVTATSSDLQHCQSSSPNYAQSNAVNVLKLVQLHLLLRIELRWRMRQVKLPSLMKMLCTKSNCNPATRQHGTKGCKIGFGFRQ